MKKTLFFACLCVSLVSCTKPATQKTAPVENSANPADEPMKKVGHDPTISKEELQRIDIKKEWVRAANQIYDKTQDAEAKMVLDHVISNLVTVAPVNQGPTAQMSIKILENSNPQIAFTYFLPLMPADNSIPQTREMISDQHVFASYQPDQRAIVVRETEACSEVLKGLMLLHEAHHAGDLLYEPYDWTDHQIFSAKERDVHNFQNRLTLKLGGESYRKALDREVVRIRGELKKSGLNGFQRQPGATTNLTIPTRTPYDHELDRALTPARSPLEEDARGTLFWIHAIFTVYEQDRDPEDAEVGKAAFMLSVYESSGLWSR